MSLSQLHKSIGQEKGEVAIPKKILSWILQAHSFLLLKSCPFQHSHDSLRFLLLYSIPVFIFSHLLNCDGLFIFLASFVCLNCPRMVACSLGLLKSVQTYLLSFQVGFLRKASRLYSILSAPRNMRLQDPFEFARETHTQLNHENPKSSCSFWYKGRKEAPRNSMSGTNRRL